MDILERQPQIRGVNSPIKQFANYYHQALKDGKIPRGDLKREFYDLAKEKPWYKSEDTLDTIWTALMDHTYDPGSSTLGRKNYTRIKQVREEKKVETTSKTKSRKTDYIIEYRLSPLGDIKGVFSSIRSAAEHLKLTVNQVKYIISRGNHKNKFKVNLTLLHRDELERCISQFKVMTPSANPDEQHIHEEQSVSKAFAKSDPQPEPTPLLNESDRLKIIKDLIIVAEFNDVLEKKLDDYDKVDAARNAYLSALSDYAYKQIVQFVNRLEQEERKLLNGLLPEED